MRRRDAGEGRFLTRSRQEWETVVPSQGAGMMDCLPKLAGAVLAARGLLDRAEVVRLERIAAGVEVHRTIDAAGASRILSCRGTH